MWSSIPIRLALATLAAGLAASPALGCTGTCLDDGGACVFGMNLDFSYGGGLLVVNKRGAAKVAWDVRSGAPAKWTARYGSVTFDLLGYSAAFTGMNEAGLVGTMEYVPAPSGHGDDARPVVPVPLWLQYQLDTAATVEDVLRSDAAIRLEGGPAHFLVCDRTAACAVIEFAGGQTVRYAGSSLPVKVMTDTPYAEAVRAWRGKGRALDDRVIRFRIAADLVTDHARAAARRRAAERLHPYQEDAARMHYSWFVQASVSRMNTAWTVVFDTRTLRLHFATDPGPELHQLGLGALDFSCRTPVQLLDVRAAPAGDVAGALTPYSHDRALAFQREAAQEVWRGMNGVLPPDAPRDPPPTPERAAESLAWFEDLPCVEEQDGAR